MRKKGPGGGAQISAALLLTPPESLKFHLSVSEALWRALLIFLCVSLFTSTPLHLRDKYFTFPPLQPTAASYCQREQREAPSSGRMVFYTMSQDQTELSINKYPVLEDWDQDQGQKTSHTSVVFIIGLYYSKKWSWSLQGHSRDRNWSTTLTDELWSWGEPQCSSLRGPEL